MSTPVYPFTRKALAGVLAALLVCGLVPAAAWATNPTDQTLSGSVAIALNPTPIASDEDLDARTAVSFLSAQGRAVSSAPTSEPVDKTPSESSQHRVCATPFLLPSEEDRAQFASALNEPRVLSATLPQVGDTRSFYSEWRDGAEYFTIECVAVGENYTFWMDTEHTSAVLPEDLDLLAKSLHDLIEAEIKLFGDWREEADVDGDGRAAFVLYPFSQVQSTETQSNVMGFFTSADLFGAEIEGSTGNLIDALHVNTAALYQDNSPSPGTFNADLALATLVHEFQHLINYARTGGYSDTWLNEAFSQAAIGLVGIDNHDDPMALAFNTATLGYMPPFVFADNYVPGVNRVEGAMPYGAWFLFSLYLASQTEGLAGGGDGIFRTILTAVKSTDDEGVYETCTRESLEEALRSIGYLGEGEGCVVGSIDELVANFGLAYLARDADGPHSLTNDPSNPSTLYGTDVPLVHIAEPAAAIPGGGALTAVDGEEGAATRANETGSPVVYLSGTAAIPLASRVFFSPNGGMLQEGDPIAVRYSHDIPGGQLVYSDIEGYSPPSSYTTYDDPIPAEAGSFALKAMLRCDAGMTMPYGSGRFVVDARTNEEEVPEVPVSTEPADTGDGANIPQQVARPTALAPTGDPLTSAAVNTLALACSAAACGFLAYRRHAKATAKEISKRA